MSKQMLLVKFDSNYADEFDVEGFTIMSETEWEEHKAKVSAFFKKREQNFSFERGRGRRPYDDGVEVYFGTNEQIIYETLDCYLRSFKVQKISDEEIEVLKKFFGKEVKFGMMCMLDDYELEEED